MRGDRKKRIKEMLTQLAAEFFRKESGRSALMTVTKSDISADFKNATIYFTVFPEDKENSAIKFAERKGGEFRKFAKENLNLRVIPYFTFKIDEGEKNFYKVIENS